MITYVTGDIWDIQAKHPGSWVCVPTNLQVKSNGHAVMGKGLAKQADDRYPTLAAAYGRHLRRSSDANRTKPLYVLSPKMIMFPTKNDWRDRSQLNLIVQSYKDVYEHMNGTHLLQITTNVYCPLVGTGEGGLTWKEVSAELRQYPCHPNFYFVLRDLALVGKVWQESEFPEEECNDL